MSEPTPVPSQAITFGQFEAKSVFSEGRFVIASAEWTAYKQFREDPIEENGSLYLHIAQMPYDETDAEKIQHLYISGGSKKFAIPGMAPDKGVDLTADLSTQRGPYSIAVAANATALAKGSNVDAWYEHLLTAGFDPSRLATNINDVLAGLDYDMITVDQPERKGLKPNPNFKQRLDDEGNPIKPTMRVPCKVNGYDVKLSIAGITPTADHTDLIDKLLAEAIKDGPVELTEFHSTLVTKCTNGELMPEDDAAANRAAMSQIMATVDAEWLKASKGFKLVKDKITAR